MAAIALSWIVTKPVPAQVSRQFDVRMAMRDGVELSADLWLPDGPGPHPAILLRTPYLKTMPLLDFPALGAYFARQGYVVGVQDVRGRGDSDGTFGFFFADANDGYDTIEWLAAQPWSTGRVGMMGVSYLGAVQWLAARTRPPHLSCIAPTAAAGFDPVFNYQGGALLIGWALPWVNGVQGRIMQRPNSAGVRWLQVMRHQPLITMDEVLGRRIPLFRAFVRYPDRHPHWDAIRFGPEVFQRISVPALHVTGWFDGDQPAALHYWRGMNAHSPARVGQYLLIGPWTHAQTFIGGDLRVGEMQFTGESVVDIRRIHLAFFDWCLKQVAPHFDFPRARIYVTGVNQWRDFGAYPPPSVRERRLYLHSGGRANSLIGDGALRWVVPGAQPPDQFTYDPRRPVPAQSGDDDYGADHRAIERRDDVLVYTSPALDAALEVIGRVSVTLFAASDGRDTDFTAKLLDVYPDGRAVKLGTLPLGVTRARYRHDGEATLLTPDRPERIRIDLFDLAHSFLRGHRVRIEISSSGFPFVSPNSNTGHAVATDTSYRVAHQTVFHDSERLSYLAFPVRDAVPSSPASSEQ